MSIFLTMDRQGNFHLVDYYSHMHSYKFTMCDRIYTKFDILTNLAIDNVIDAICPECYKIYDKQHGQNINVNPRLVHGKLLKHLHASYHDIKEGTDRIASKYASGLHPNGWYKLRYYKKVLQRK